MLEMVLIANYLTKTEKIFLFLACMGFILYFLFLYYEMIAEVKARVPETRVVLLSLWGLFPVLAAHKRAIPQSHKRLKALLCLLIVFVLFVLSVDVMFR
jgi:hypothetical protein